MRQGITDCILDDAHCRSACGTHAKKAERQEIGGHVLAARARVEVAHPMSVETAPVEAAEPEALCEEPPARG